MRANACIHFTGIQNEKCAAGVEYKSVRDSSGPGMARWPCLTLNCKPAITECARREFPTPEQIEQWEREILAVTERMVKDAAEGRCIHCHEPIDVREHVGRCVYAKPCGHRQGQALNAEEK